MPVVISVAGALDDQTLGVLDRQIVAFEAANPDLLVEIVAPEGAGEFQAEAATLLAQGDPSRDVYIVPSAWVPALAADEGVLALNPHLEQAGLDLAGFFPAAMAVVMYDGALAALP